MPNDLPGYPTSDYGGECKECGRLVSDYSQKYCQKCRTGRRHNPRPRKPKFSADQFEFSFVSNLQPPIQRP